MGHIYATVPNRHMDPVAVQTLQPPAALLRLTDLHALCALRMSGGLLRSAMDHSVPEV